MSNPHEIASTAVAMTLINHDDSPHVSMQKINLNIQNPNTTLVLINIQILKQGNSLYTSVTVQEE